MTLETRQDAVANVRLPRPLRARVKQLAQRRGVAMSPIYRDALALGVVVLETLDTNKARPGDGQAM